MQWIWPLALMSITGCVLYFVAGWLANVQLQLRAGHQVKSVERLAWVVYLLVVCLPWGVVVIVPDSWLVSTKENAFWGYCWAGLWFCSLVPGLLRYQSTIRAAEHGDAT